jgi:hypothetical protein
MMMVMITLLCNCITNWCERQGERGSDAVEGLYGRTLWHSTTGTMTGCGIFFVAFDTLDVELLRRARSCYDCIYLRSWGHVESRIDF